MLPSIAIKTSFLWLEMLMRSSGVTTMPQHFARVHARVQRLRGGALVQTRVLTMS